MDDKWAGLVTLRERREAHVGIWYWNLKESPLGRCRCL